MIVSATKPCFGTPLPRVTPESVGVRSADVAAFVDEARARNINLHSFLMLRGDKVYAESYYAPYAPDQLQTVYSLSKSFTSVAIGIAAEEGILDLDEKIVDIFADELTEEPCEQLKALTLRHCLRMSTGQPREIPGPDLLRAFLAMPFADMPGEVFRYNTMATYMLSATLNKRGIDLEKYLDEKLFAPMGISGLHWMRCLRGIPAGGYGLSLLPEVIAKFGILVKNGGAWEGKQLVPKAYLDLATTKQIDNSRDNNGEWSYGYGYKFWMCRYDTYRGDGAFGQLCVVSPKKDAVLAVTAYTEDIQAELDDYFETILLKMSDEPLPEDPAAHAALCEKLASAACYVAPLPDEGAPFPQALLDGTLTLRTGGGAKSVNVGPKVMTSEQQPGEVSFRFERTADGALHAVIDGVGDLLLDRGSLRDQITICEINPLGYGRAVFETRALAGYGVKTDGTVCLRVDMLELLRDELIELIPEGGSWRVRMTDVHLPYKTEVLFDSQEA